VSSVFSIRDTVVSLEKMDIDEFLDREIADLGSDLKEGEIEEIAGSGHERMDVANQVGELIGASSLFADTSEDTRQTCEAEHYVLVKVEKQRVFDFIKEDSQFKKDLAARLAKN